MLITKAQIIVIEDITGEDGRKAGERLRVLYQAIPTCGECGHPMKIRDFVWRTIITMSGCRGASGCAAWCAPRRIATCTPIPAATCPGACCPTAFTAPRSIRPSPRAGTMCPAPKHPSPHLKMGAADGRLPDRQRAFSAPL